MVEFLSDAWLEALAAGLVDSARAGGSDVVASASAVAVAVAVGQIVRGVPASLGTIDAATGERQVSYTVVVGNPGPRVVPGTTAGADVVFMLAYGDARALACGDTSAATLLEKGRIKIRGDARRLVEANSLLSAVASESSALARQTNFT